MGVRIRSAYRRPPGAAENVRVWRRTKPARSGRHSNMTHNPRPGGPAPRQADDPQCRTASADSAERPPSSIFFGGSKRRGSGKSRWRIGLGRSGVHPGHDQGRPRPNAAPLVPRLTNRTAIGAFSETVRRRSNPHPAHASISDGRARHSFPRVLVRLSIGPSPSARHARSIQSTNSDNLGRQRGVV